MLVKVCGLINEQNLKGITPLDIDMIGLNFYKPSKRYLGDSRSSFSALIPDHISRVGVFVDESFDEVLALTKQYKLDYVQLHGSEDADYCTRMKKHTGVIKAFGFSNGMNIDKSTVHYDMCDYFIFDTKTKLHGGSGRKFDWSILETYTGGTPFLLSGGLGPDDYNAIKSIKHLQLVGVDINSKFETEPGVKDINKLKYFLENIK